MQRGARLSALLGLREFRALWLAELLSVGGDQLARVALAVLVYERTHSAAWTALTYALTFLPALVGGIALSWLADRFRRRELIIVIDLCRAVLAAAMALPGSPLPVLGLLVVLLTFAGGPFKAAQLSLLYDVLGEDRYAAGLAVRNISTQFAQLVGFATGGAVLTVMSPYAALAVNATTFLVAAGLVRAGVTVRPNPRDGARSVAGTGMREVALLIWRDRRTRGLLALSWLVGLFVVPEGLAAPYAADFGGGTVAVGLLMAADPAGSIVGAWACGRLPAGSRARLMVPLAVLAGVFLVCCAPGPGLWLSVLLWAASGAAYTGYLIEAQSTFVREVPDRCRGAAVGLGSAGGQASQGLAIALGGAVADAVGPSVTVAVAGAGGAIAAAVVGRTWLGVSRR